MRPIDMSEWDTYMKCMLVGRNAWDNYDRGYTDALDQMDDWLDAQPSLTLDDLRPRGRWKAYKPDGRGYTCGFICSSCSAVVYTDYSQRDCVYNYCPNCGADMRGGGGDA